MIEKKTKYIVSKQKHKQLRSVTIYILPADKFVWFDIYPKSTVQRFVGFVYKIYAIDKKGSARFLLHLHFEQIMFCHSCWAPSNTG